VELPNLWVSAAGEIVYDYYPQPEPGKDWGDIQYYQIDYQSGLTFVHFDATGIAAASDGKTKSVFAPYSHDADTTMTPEPSTLLLLGVGLIGLAGAGIRKRYRV
jgi:hypothetical protein